MLPTGGVDVGRCRTLRFYTCISGGDCAAHWRLDPRRHSSRELCRDAAAMARLQPIHVIGRCAKTRALSLQRQSGRTCAHLPQPASRIRACPRAACLEAPCVCALHSLATEREHSYSEQACARAELSEEAHLADGEWQRLLPDGHAGLAEVKWSPNRFTPFLCIGPQARAGQPGLCYGRSVVACRIICGRVETVRQYAVSALAGLVESSRFRNAQCQCSCRWPIAASACCPQPLY